MAELSHAFAREVPEHFQRDMGYSSKEFFRVLPAALGEFVCHEAGDQLHIRHPDDERELVLSIRKLPDRRLGAFRIERIAVEFRFSNMSASQRKQFMRRFDRHFQRGGG